MVTTGATIIGGSRRVAGASTFVAASNLAATSSRRAAASTKLSTFAVAVAVTSAASDAIGRAVLISFNKIMYLLAGVYMRSRA